jgi:hypothetical protein
MYNMTARRFTFLAALATSFALALSLFVVFA